MAEICLECLNKLEGKKLKRRHVVLEWDICEWCGQWKECVIMIRGYYWRFFS